VKPLRSPLAKKHHAVVEANEIDDTAAAETSVEFFFSVDLSLPSFIPKNVVFRVFIPIIRKSILSLKKIVEERQQLQTKE
jgi:hypothetical protein